MIGNHLGLEAPNVCYTFGAIEMFGWMIPKKYSFKVSVHWSFYETWKISCPPSCFILATCIIARTTFSTEGKQDKELLLGRLLRSPK
jgi:hypothetical protein